MFKCSAVQTNHLCRLDMAPVRPLYVLCCGIQSPLSFSSTCKLHCQPLRSVLALKYFWYRRTTPKHFYLLFRLWTASSSILVSITNRQITKFVYLSIHTYIYTFIHTFIHVFIQTTTFGCLLNVMYCPKWWRKNREQDRPLPLRRL